MSKILLRFCKFMLAMTCFEVAITPKDAGHYAQLKVDVLHWAGEVAKLQVRAVK